MGAPELPPLVRYERRGPVVVVTIDNPPVNVLSARVLDALRARLDQAEADPEARVVVLAGAAERAFAAGADIREMAPMGPDQAMEHGGRGQSITVRIETLPLPVIAAVHGSCLGGGCEIALACDFVLASEDALFGQPEINLGVMPGWGGTRRLPRRIGAARARAWIFLGRTVPAGEAFSAGLVYRVVPRTELLDSAMKLAEELAQKPALALAAAKYAINRSLDPLEPEGLAFELRLWKQLFGTLDQRDGMAAFLGKRSWKSEGRSDWAERSRGFPWEPRRRSAPPHRSRRAGKPGAKRKN